MGVVVMNYFRETLIYIGIRSNREWKNFMLKESPHILFAMTYRRCESRDQMANFNNLSSEND